MKKIFMLLFSTAVLSSAFAQSHRDADDRNWNQNNNQNVFKSDHGRDDRNNNALRQRDFQIQRITSEYDYRIQQVSYDRLLNRRQKRNTIKMLEYQKSQEINNVISQYNASVYNNRNRNYDRRNNDHNYSNGQYNR